MIIIDKLTYQMENNDRIAVTEFSNLPAVFLYIVFSNAPEKSMSMS